jgi:hypothetical protein
LLIDRTPVGPIICLTAIWPFPFQLRITAETSLIGTKQISLLMGLFY